MDSLKDWSDTLCREYVDEFSKKQGLAFDGWVGDDIGGIASFIEQYFFDFRDIVYDINSGQSVGLIMEWQDNTIENARSVINYYRYSKGLRYEDL